MNQKNNDLKCLARFPIESLFCLGQSVSVTPYNSLISPNYPQPSFLPAQYLAPQSPYQRFSYQNLLSPTQVNTYRSNQEELTNIQEELTDQGSVEKKLSNVQLIDIENMLQLGGNRQEMNSDISLSEFVNQQEFDKFIMEEQNEKNNEQREELFDSEEEEEDVELEFLNEVDQLLENVQKTNYERIVNYQEFDYQRLLPLKMDLNEIKNNKFQGRINFAFIKDQQQQNKVLQFSLMKSIRKNQVTFCQNSVRFNEGLRKQSKNMKKIKQVRERKQQYNEIQR